MKSKPLLLLAFLISGTLLFSHFSLAVSRSEPTNAGGTAPGELPLGAFCGEKNHGVTWCQFDFVNLAIHRSQVQGSRIYILGYLSVDDKQVILFANKQDYEMMERGRSLEIRGGLSELREMVEEHGYRYVRIEGSFEIDSKSDKAGRLGILEPPFSVKIALPRSAKGSYEDIGVDVEYLE